MELTRPEGAGIAGLRMVCGDRADEEGGDARDETRDCHQDNHVEVDHVALEPVARDAASKHLEPQVRWSRLCCHERMQRATRRGAMRGALRSEECRWMGTGRGGRSATPQ